MLRSTLLACALAALSTLAACPPPAGTTCRTSNDCRSDEICFEQLCRTACNSNVDCRGTEVCQSGYCQARSDGGSSDGGSSDANATDLGRVDRSATDHEPRDTERRDSTALDQVAIDGATVDQRASDTSLVDHQVVDRVISDQQRTDTVASDRPATDQGVSDRAQPDTYAPDRATADACAPTSPYWWDTAFAHRAPLIVSATPVGYTLELVLTDKSATELTDRALSVGGTDVRVVWVGATNAVEIDRELIAFGPDRVVLRFRSQTAIPYGGSRGDYFLYVGSSGSNAPPADLKKVYLFFEDFETHAVGGNASAAFHSYPSASWQVVDSGSAHHVFKATGVGSHYAELIGATPADGVIEARIALLGTSGDPSAAGLIFRATGMPNLGGDFYYGRISRISTTLGLCEVSNGNQVGCLATAPFVANADTWYPLEIRFHATDAIATVDHSVSANASGLATINQQLALMTYSSDALFDDVKVRPLVVPEPTVALAAWEVNCQ